MRHIHICYVDSIGSSLGRCSQWDSRVQSPNGQVVHTGNGSLVCSVLDTDNHWGPLSVQGKKMCKGAYELTL